MPTTNPTQGVDYVVALLIEGQRFGHGHCRVEMVRLPERVPQGQPMQHRQHGYLHIRLWDLLQPQYDALAALIRFRDGRYPHCEAVQIPAAAADLDWEKPEVRSALLFAGERITSVGSFVPDSVTVTVNNKSGVTRYTVDVGGVLIGEQQWVTK